MREREKRKTMQPKRENKESNLNCNKLQSYPFKHSHNNNEEE